MTKTGDTPSLSDVIEAMFERRLLDLHTSIPGIVQDYDPIKKTAKVRPALKRRFKDSREDQELNVLIDVPIGFYQTNSCIFSIPIQKGDEVLLIFSERSMDNWLKSGGIVTPNESRKFDLSDAVALPLLKPTGTGPAADPDCVYLKHGTSEFKVSQDGKFAITNGSEELVDLVKQLADACASIITNTKIGPQAPINAGQFSALSGKISNLKL